MATSTPKKRGRPPTGRGKAIQLRLRPELLAAVERERERLQRERPGVNVGTATVINEILGRALLTKGGR